MRDGQHAGVKPKFLGSEFAAEGRQNACRGHAVHDVHEPAGTDMSGVHVRLIRPRTARARRWRVLALTFAMLLLYRAERAPRPRAPTAFGRFANVVDRRLAAAATRCMPTIPLRDLDQIRAFLVGQAPPALCDLPWLPVYLTAMFLLHPAVRCAGLRRRHVDRWLPARGGTVGPAPSAARRYDRRTTLAPGGSSQPRGPYRICQCPAARMAGAQYAVA